MIIRLLTFTITFSQIYILSKKNYIDSMTLELQPFVTCPNAYIDSAITILHAKMLCMGESLCMQWSKFMKML